MNIIDLKHKLLKNNQAILGAGPMSLNSINSVINIANKYNIPIQLIASRRQIDSEYHGNGYVNNWSTEEFSEYVLSKSDNNLVYLSRDHSGPWQGNFEVENNLNLKESMDSCKKSLKEDIDRGFKFLHLDPCIDINTELSIDEVLNRLFELYGYIYEYSNGLQDIYVEVGTDLQSESISTLEETKYILEKIKKFTSKEIMHSPSFFVIQNGTKVLESENIGEYKSKVNQDKKFTQDIKALSNLINSYNLLTKAHNCDYLDNHILKTLPENGINGINIAPEYGVVETKAIIELCKNNNLTSEIDNFLNISFKSNKWKKWLKNDSKLNDDEKAILSGHYIFSSLEFIELEKRIINKLNKKNIDFKLEVYKKVYYSIVRSLKGLNWNIDY